MSTEKDNTGLSPTVEVVDKSAENSLTLLDGWLTVTSTAHLPMMLSDHQQEVLDLLTGCTDPHPKVRVKEVKPEPVIDEAERKAQVARSLAYERYLRGKPKLTDVQKGLRKKKSDVKSKRRKAILKRHK